MSLVNLSHVCSHLQNASLARLGLTSIPYSRLHLSLALLLQKQGFLSQVKLAGPSPPASCFPPGEDNHHITGHPRSDRGKLTPEAALQRIGTRAAKEGEVYLRGRGFAEDAIQFALFGREKTKEQLESDGWNEVAARFLLEHHARSIEELQALELDAVAITIIEKYRPSLKNNKIKVVEIHGDRATFEKREAESEPVKNGLRPPRRYDSFIQEKLYEEVMRDASILRAFDVETLRYFAGDKRYFSPQEQELHGINMDVMGLTVTNQPMPPPLPKKFEDPWQLEEEGVVTQANRASRRLWLGLKYWDGLPVLRKARMLSKPTKRISLTYNDLGMLVRGRNAGEVKPLTQVGEIMAVKTKLGVLEVRECVERKLGGMVLCRIW